MAVITVDVHQDLAHHPDVLTRRLEVADYSFVTFESVQTLVEEKRLGDLLSSFSSRRLQRQLRKMMQTNPEGINILGLRASGSVSLLQGTLWLDVPPELALDLLKWQGLGGLIGFLPHNKGRVLETLQQWQAVLQPGRHLFSILAGDDRGRREQKEAKRQDMKPVAQALRRLFKGVGYELGVRWAEAAGQDLLKALTMPDESLTASGVHRGIIKKRRELIP